MLVARSIGGLSDILLIVATLLEVFVVLLLLRRIRIKYLITALLMNDRIVDNALIRDARIVK